jgi:hypothetical protein
VSIDQFIGRKSCRAACSSLCISIQFSVNDSDRSEGQSLCTGLLDFAFIWLEMVEILPSLIGCVTFNDNLKNKNIKIDYY